MSGGFFDYRNYELNDWADRIDNHIEKALSDKTDEYGYKPQYSQETIECLMFCSALCRGLECALHGADYLIEGDIGEESFIKKTQEAQKIMIDLGIKKDKEMEKRRIDEYFRYIPKNKNEST